MEAKEILKQVRKEDRNYEHFCKIFRKHWKILKDLLKYGDSVISDWDKDMFLYDWEQSEETMCEHFYNGVPAWKQYYSSGHMSLPRNHVIYYLNQLKVLKKHFESEQKQMTLF